MHVRRAAAGPRSARTAAPGRVDVAADLGHERREAARAGTCEVSGRPPASEMTSGRSVMRHQVAHRRGRHDLRARREEAGVALEVVGRPSVAGARSCGSRFAAGARALAASLVYRHATRRHASVPDTAWTSSSTSSRAGGSRAASASGRFLPALLGRGAGAPPTSASTSTARTSRSSRAPGSCSPIVVALVRLRRSAGARLARPARGGPSRRCRSPGSACGALLFAGALDDRPATSGGRAWSAASPARRSARAVVARADRPRARGASTPPRPRRSAALRRGRRRSSLAGLACSCPPLGLVALAFLVWLLARRRAGARARSTRAAHPAVSGRGAQARPRRHRRAEAGDARARGRDRPRAGARRRVMERGHLRRRLRRGLPVGDAGLRRVDRHRRAPGPPPHPVDELVPPRRAPLRRVRLELQRLARASASSARSPTRSTT